MQWCSGNIDMTVTSDAEGQHGLVVKVLDSQSKGRGFDSKNTLKVKMALNKIRANANKQQQTTNF